MCLPQPLLLDLSTTTPVSFWLINVYLENGTFLYNVTVMDPNVTVVTLMGLNSGSIYLVEIAGSNTRGIGNFSHIVSQTTLEGIHINIKCIIF